MNLEPSHDAKISSGTLPSRRWQYVFPAIISLQLLICCIITSAKKLFWFDEMLTYYLTAGTSFGHMFAGAQSHFNTLPPLYNIALWSWARMFGTSELTLRLPSALCFCGAFWVLWLTLRPRFGAMPAFLGIACVLTSHLVSYNSEARAYSLYLFFCALTIYQFARWSEQPKRGWGFYAVNTLFHAGMLFTHLFGVLYSACLLLTVLFLDVRKRRFSAPMAGSVVLAWILFAALWLKPTLHQMGAFKPYSWVPIPHLRDLAEMVLTDATRMPILLAVGLTACFILAQTAKQQPMFLPADSASDKSLPETTAPTSRNDWRSLESQGSGDALNLALLAGVFLLLPPLAAYIISHVSASVFVDRYFIPSLLAWAILLTGLASELQFRLDTWRIGSDRLQSPAIIVTVVLLVLTIVTIGTLRRNEYIRYGVDVATLPGVQSGAQNMPIVCENYIYFPAHAHYSPNGSWYTFLLDEDAALQSAPEDLGWEMVQYKLMAALHEYDPDLSIRDWRAFLRDHNQFVVILDKRSRWSRLRLQSNPQYDCKETIEQGMRLLWVRKKR